MTLLRTVCTIHRSHTFYQQLFIKEHMEIVNFCLAQSPLMVPWLFSSDFVSITFLCYIMLLCAVLLPPRTMHLFSVLCIIAHTASNAHNTCACQSDSVVFEIPQFLPSTRHFSLSFAYDSKFWNDLPDDVRSASSINTFRKWLKAYLSSKAYPP